MISCQLVTLTYTLIFFTIIVAIYIVYYEVSPFSSEHDILDSYLNRLNFYQLSLGFSQYEQINESI